MTFKRSHARWAIHHEGYPTLITVALIGLGVTLLVGIVAPNALIISVPLMLIVGGLVTQFFRHPVRHIPQTAHTLLSPADGTVVAIERVHEGEYFQRECVKISVYMSALNVHLNRAPITGRVVYTHYHAGRYLVAFHPKASELNERNTVVLADPHGREVLVRQIAGLLARRIVSYLAVEQTVQAGDQLGFIKFGSRCDVFIPDSCEILVQCQQRVRGGETLLARWTPVE